MIILTDPSNVTTRQQIQDTTTKNNSTPELSRESLLDTPNMDSTNMQQLMSLLPEDLYIEPITEYEPSILFQIIKDQFLKINFSPEVLKIYIFR